MVLLIFLFILIITQICKSFHLSIITTNNSFHALKTILKHETFLRVIPDLQTVDELKLNTTFVSDAELSAYIFKSPIESLKRADNTPDEIMRVAANKAHVLNPLSFKQVFRSQPPNHFKNPAISEWKGRTLLAWVNGVNKNGVPYMTDSPINNLVRLSWLKNGSYSEVSDEVIFGIGPDTVVDYKVYGTRYHEDPRLLPLSNGSMLLTYDLMDFDHVIHYFAVMMVINSTTNLVQYHHTLLALNHKNWVPFEYMHKNKSVIHYIRTMNPLDIVTIERYGNGTEQLTSIHNIYNHTHNTNHNSSAHDATIIDVSKHHVSLPFNMDYMNKALRGSTPLIHINGVYFSFFHTKTQLPHALRRCTYFMGAVTYCPHPPFQIHSMSSYPIPFPGLYDGPWLSDQIDYVIYPAGIVLDKTHEFMIVSAGYQDHEMLVFNFSVAEVFDSLVLVNKCNV